MKMTRGLDDDQRRELCPWSLASLSKKTSRGHELVRGIPRSGSDTLSPVIRKTNDLLKYAKYVRKNDEILQWNV